MVTQLTSSVLVTGAITAQFRLSVFWALPGPLIEQGR